MAVRVDRCGSDRWQRRCCIEPCCSDEWYYNVEGMVDNRWNNHSRLEGGVIFDVDTSWQIQTTMQL